MYMYPKSFNKVIGMIVLMKTNNRWDSTLDLKWHLMDESHGNATANVRNKTRNKTNKTRIRRNKTLFNWRDSRQ